jgi:NADH-quinone oxidoreductase subunit F
MDLKFTADAPTPEETAAVDHCLAAFPADGHRRQYLLPALHALQGRMGWISPGGLNYACRRLEVPPAEAFGVADFYALFQTRPQPPTAVHVCDDIACQVRGAESLCTQLRAALGPEVAFHRSPCLGLCERAPAALVTQAGRHPSDLAVAPASPEAIQATLAHLLDRAATERSELHPLAPEPLSSSFSSEGMPVEAGAGRPRRGGESEAPSRPERSEPPSLNDYEPPAEGVPHQLPPPPPPIAASIPQAGDPALVLLARIGRIDPESLDDYRAAGGFLALRRAIEMGPEAVVREVTDAKLVGRGGAAFPTGLKWQGALSAPLPRYLICNADESEPGTFKDRVLMEHDPYALVEAMTIAGFATGCEKGYLYIRGEYPLATARLENAIRRAHERGFLGADILGDGVRFELELRRGAGAYICGEETALLNSLEGRRGEPRNKPPFPTQAGLFGKPTVINNVETLVNVLPIVIGGAKAYAATGTERSTGPKLFCVSGHAARPGVYEFPFGITLRQLLDRAGGIAGSGRLQAVLLGGAAGAFVTPDELDVPLTFEGTREIGATLGSAVVMPFDDTVDLRRILRRIAQFFRDESCGQCVPCRVGTVRQEELLHRLAADRPLGSAAAEVAMLKELGQVMRDASICGLGQTASAAVESALARFPLYSETR